MHVCACVCVTNVCTFFSYCHAWRHDFRVTPHTPTDTHRLALNTHAPGWAGHWCMCTPDMLPTCTSVTCTHHGAVSARTRLLPRPLMCFLTPLPTHTCCPQRSCQKKSTGSWVHVKEPTNWTIQISKGGNSRHVTHAREGRKTYQGGFVDIFDSNDLDPWYTHCDTHCL